VQGGVRPRPPVVGGAACTPEVDVAELVAQAKLGDTAAFTYLYRRYVARVYDYAVWRIQNRHVAEEVTQEVFLRAFRGITGCREGASFGGWLLGIARFVIADQYRASPPGTVALDESLEREDPEPLPEEQALEAERHNELRAAREHCLSPSERELFDLLLADLTDREIAVALGRRYGAVRTAHWRLVSKLRVCFAHLRGRYVAS
jgi:RNA polymerase sigma-70 factor (ECF subfamily)